MGGYLPHIVNSSFVDLHRTEHKGIRTEREAAAIYLRLA
jgi:hypothetical protein